MRRGLFMTQFAQGVAQLGRARGLGPRGRRFESCHPDSASLLVSIFCGGASSLIEGWHGDDYLVLFNEAETSALSARYEVGRYLPEHVITGLRGWDYFIVRGADGRCATVPTVPITAEHLAPLEFAVDAERIVSDERFRGKMKWYTKPIAFGGNPADNGNIEWVSLEQHISLVKWWNDRYPSLK